MRKYGELRIRFSGLQHEKLWREENAKILKANAKLKEREGAEDALFDHFLFQAFRLQFLSATKTS